VPVADTWRRAPSGTHERHWRGSASALPSFVDVEGRVEVVAPQRDPRRGLATAARAGDEARGGVKAVGERANEGAARVACGRRRSTHSAPRCPAVMRCRFAWSSGRHRCTGGRPATEGGWADERTATERTHSSHLMITRRTHQPLSPSLRRHASFACSARSSVIVSGVLVVAATERPQRGAAKSKPAALAEPPRRSS
jgi:hypothetical protein